jgi:hypothetical protein
MAKIEIDIPAEKVNRVITAIKGVYPITQIEDPENPGEFIDEFTDMQWTRKILINQLKRIVRKYENKVAKSTVENIDLS